MSDKVRIGRTDLYVNPIGFGTNAVGGHNIYPNLNDENGREMVRTALNNGINFFDTAYMYGPERSEQLIGEVIKETGKREDVVIATKAAHKFVDGKMTLDNSPDFLKASVDSSLKRLQTDYLDLFYIHYPDESTRKEEAVGALQELKEEGKIRAIGVSNFSLDQLKEGNKDGYIEVLQSHYNLFKRDAERDLLPYALLNDISFIPYFPLASGLLGGKYTKDSTFDDSRARNLLFQGDAFLENLAKVDQVRQIAKTYETEVPYVVLAWYLAQDGIDALIPGAKKPDQVARNLQTLKVKLTLEDIQKIDQIFKS